MAEEKWPQVESAKDKDMGQHWEVEASVCSRGLNKATWNVKKEQPCGGCKALKRFTV